MFGSFAAFNSKSVEQGRAAARLKVVGDLTLHGSARPITSNVTLVKIGANPQYDCASLLCDHDNSPFSI